MTPAEPARAEPARAEPARAEPAGGPQIPARPAFGIVPPPRDPHRPYRVLLVCLGNICRSPMAARVLADELAKAGLSDRVTVESAGTGDWHLGEEMDARAAAELARRGYDDGSGHESRQIHRDWLDRYDLLLAMDQANLADLRRLAGGDPGLWPRMQLMRSFDPAAPPGAEVPDPYYGSPADYAEVFDLVEAAAKGLADQLAADL